MAYEKIKKDGTENEVTNVTEDKAFNHAMNEVFLNKKQKTEFIHKFAVPLMVEQFNLEELAFKFAICEINEKPNVKHEFIEYFYSGNWIRVEEDEE